MQLIIWKVYYMGELEETTYHITSSTNETAYKWMAEQWINILRAQGWLFDKDEAFFEWRRVFERIPKFPHTVRTQKVFGNSSCQRIPSSSYMIECTICNNMYYDCDNLKEWTVEECDECTDVEICCFT